MEWRQRQRVRGLTGPGWKRQWRATGDGHHTFDGERVDCEGRGQGCAPFEGTCMHARTTRHASGGDPGLARRGAQSDGQSVIVAHSRDGEECCRWRHPLVKVAAADGRIVGFNRVKGYDHKVGSLGQLHLRHHVRRFLAQVHTSVSFPRLPAERVSAGEGKERAGAASVRAGVRAGWKVAHVDITFAPRVKDWIETAAASRSAISRFACWMRMRTMRRRLHA